MLDNANTDEKKPVVGRGGVGEGEVDEARRHRTEYCDARQLLSETLRLRRAAQLQRAAAGENETTATAPTAVVSGPRRSAAGDAAATTTTITSRRRKKPRHDRDTTTDQPQPRARRIMFHEYKGPSDDDAETVTTISGPTSANHLASSTSLGCTSQYMMTTAFFPNAVTSTWNDLRDEQPHDGSCTSQSFYSPFATTNFGSFRPTSLSLPRFSELQRSLCSPTHRQDFADMTCANHPQVTQRSRPEAVSCAASLLHRSSLVVTSSSSSSSVEQSTPSSQSQLCHPPVDVTSSLLPSVGVDHQITCFPSVTASYRPNNGNKSVVKFSSIYILPTYTMFICSFYNTSMARNGLLSSCANVPLRNYSFTDLYAL